MNLPRGWIVLTRRDGVPIYVQVRNILAVHQDGGQTVVRWDSPSDCAWTFRESVEQVLRLCESATDT